MRLLKLRLHDVYCFHNTNLTFDRRVTSIIGENDTGKTNLLKCLHSLFGEKGSLDNLANMRCQFEFCSGQPQVELWFSVDDSETQRLRDLLKTKSKLASRELIIKCFAGKANLFWGKHPRQCKERLDAPAFRAIQRGLLQVFMFEAPVSPIHGSIRVSELMRNFESPEGRLLQLGGLQAEHLKHLQLGHNEGYIALGEAGIQLTKQLQNMWTQRRSIEIHLHPCNDEEGKPSIEFRVRDDLGATVPLLSRGDGLRWFLNFFAEMRSMALREEVMAALLLIDEPGNHLHPAAQSDLCDLFNEDLIAGANTQVLYTTHSPFMLNWSQPHQVRVLETTDHGTIIVDKPYHSEESLNFWEPFRRNIGLFLGDLGLLGTNNLLVEGATDQIMLSFLSRYAKVQGQRHLNLGERRIIPFGDHRALLLLVSTCLAYGREVAILVDTDESGKKAIKALLSDGLKWVPVFSYGDFCRRYLFSGLEICLEDIFERAWYLRQVNEFYERFPWFDRRIEVSDLDENQAVAKALEEYFAAAEWKDKKTHNFSKASVAIHIASVEPNVSWETMPIAFGSLCRRVGYPLGVFQLECYQDASETELKREGWAFSLSVSLGINSGVKQFKIEPLKNGNKLVDGSIEFPVASDISDLVVWDVWERKFLGLDDVPCLRGGSARFLALGNDSLLEADLLKSTACFEDGTTKEYECPFRADVKDAKINPWERFAKKHKIGDIVEGEVSDFSHYTPAGFYVKTEEDIEGFVHISQISTGKWVHDVSYEVTIGQKIRAQILDISPSEESLSLSLIGVDQDSSSA